MDYFRLIKPVWGKKLLTNGQPNPDFKQEIEGPDTIEVIDPEESFIRQKNDEGYNVYFLPNRPSVDIHQKGAPFAGGKHVDDFRFIFIDMDLKEGVFSSKEDFLQVIASFPVKPTMTVDSGNGIHVYWGINNLTRDEYVMAQIMLIEFFHTDISVFTVLQLMRYPGFMNTKVLGDFKPAFIVDELSSNETYDLGLVTCHLAAPSQEGQDRGMLHLNKLDGKLTVKIAENANLDELPDSFVKLLDNPKLPLIDQLFNDPKAYRGDRSSADMKLANELKRLGLNKMDALAVLANTQKALDKGASRISYAQNTIDKVYIDKLNTKYQSVGDILNTPESDWDMGDLVNGPEYLDSGVLHNKWRKRELLGIIAGTGMGKTSFTLNAIRDMIKNNPGNEDLHIFFSLEMEKTEIAIKWRDLAGADTELASRLIVVDNFDDNGNPRNLGLQEMESVCEEIKQLSSKELGSVTIDHIGIIGRHIDIRKRFTFSIESEQHSGHGNIRTMSMASLANQLKPFAKLVNAFVIVLTQTTKEKGAGDTPIYKDGAYGISNYENIMDRIITLWQPLSKVKSMTTISFLAWQYAKIRKIHKNDKIVTENPHLLTYDSESGNLRLSSPSEYAAFEELRPKADALRAQIAKKQGVSYSLQTGLVNVTERLKQHELEKAQRNR